MSLAIGILMILSLTSSNILFGSHKVKKYIILKIVEKWAATEGQAFFYQF